MTDFEALYQRYAADLYRYGLYLTGNHAQAQDLASEAFVRAWNSPGGVRAGTAKAYFVTIVRHCFLNQQRKQTKQTALDDSLPDPAASPGQAAERNDQVRHALAALQQLPELDRSVFLLRVQEELSYQEIADTVGISLTAVKVKIHRARLRMAQILSPEEREL